MICESSAPRGARGFGERRDDHRGDQSLTVRESDRLLGTAYDDLDVICASASRLGPGRLLPRGAVRVDRGLPGHRRKSGGLRVRAATTSRHAGRNRSMLASAFASRAPSNRTIASATPRSRGSRGAGPSHSCPSIRRAPTRRAPGPSPNPWRGQWRPVRAKRSCAADRPVAGRPPPSCAKRTRSA
jgi:hypothetical protein